MRVTLEEIHRAGPLIEVFLRLFVGNWSTTNGNADVWVATSVSLRLCLYMERVTAEDEFPDLVLQLLWQAQEWRGRTVVLSSV